MKVITTKSCLEMCELRKKNRGQRMIQGQGDQGKQKETFLRVPWYKSLFLNYLRRHMLLLEVHILQDVIF